MNFSVVEVVERKMPELLREGRERLLLPSLRYLTPNEVFEASARYHRLEQGIAFVAAPPERHRLVLELKEELQVLLEVH